MMVSYFPQCRSCLKSLAIGTRANQKQYCDDCIKERKRLRNKSYRKKFFIQKRIKPTYITLKQLEFIKTSGMNFSAFVRAKLDEEMRKV